MSISVLIATHNSAELVSAGLESVTAQRRRPDEVVVVDDDSQDNTLEVVERWAAEQPFPVRILANQVPHDPNASRGPAGGRMTGLMGSSSDLIALLDHDDSMLPDHLRLTEQALLQHPELELVFGDATEFTTDSADRSLFAGKAIESVAYRQGANGLRILAEPMLPSVITGSYIPTASNLWRRETALRLGGFDGRVGACDDLLFFLSLSRLGSVGYYPQAIARRRIHHDNLSHARYAMERCRDHLAVLRLILDGSERLHLTQEEQRLIGSHSVRITQELLYHASLRGTTAYFSQLERLEGISESPHTKDIARAFLSSLRHLVEAARGG